MITQADGALLIYAASKWVKAGRCSAIAAMSKTTGADYLACIEIEDAAELAFAELVSKLTEPRP